MSRRSVGVIRGVCAVIVMMLTVVASPKMVSAHATLDGSTPAASSVVPESPDEIVLDFDETVEPRLGSLKLFDDDGGEVDVGDLTRDMSDESIVRASVTALSDGPYVVVWRVTSSDGHPVTGAFPFEVGDVSTGPTTDLLADVVGSLTPDRTLGFAIGVLRFFALLAMVVLIGFLVTTADSVVIRRHRSRVVSGLCLATLVVTSIGILALQGPYTTNGHWSDVLSASLITDVVSTRLGTALIVRLVLVLLLAALFAPALLRRRDALWSNAASLSVVGLVLTFSASGHASARPWPVLLVGLDVVHLLGVGAWIGALLATFAVGTDVFGSDDVTSGVRIIDRLSRIFTIAMPIVVVTGAIQAWLLIDDRSNILDTTYGRAFVGKLVLVALAVALGTGIRRRLAHGDRASVKRALSFEAVVACVVLGLAAVMVSTAPTSNELGGSSSVTLVQGGVLADITVNPARVGSVEIHTLFSPPGGSLAPVNDVKVRLQLPSRDIPVIPVDMVELGPNHWSGVAQIPYPGEWSLDVVVSPTKNATLSFSTTVKVRD